MLIITQIVMLLWIPAVLLLFAVLPPRRAVITAFLAGFLFLPMVTYKLPVLPDYTKMSATCAGVLFGAIIFDSPRVFAFRPKLFDLPMAVFCLSPFVSSIANGLEPWDGVSGILANIITWGFPYLIGRVYFTDLAGLRELAIGIFIGGLVYIPFCLFEMRMSPQLHNIIYGFHANRMQARLGGWRPQVFLQDGLQLGMWMAMASMAGIWLWWTGNVKRLAGFSMLWLVWPLAMTTMLCRSTGALALGILGLGAMWLCRVTGSRLALVGLLLIAPAYIALRVSGSWHGELISGLAAMVDPDRAQSFQFRIDNEDLLITKALEKPFFGWGGWGRSRVYDEWGKDISITDGLWIIELGTHGFLGLVSLYALLLLPLSLLVYKLPINKLAAADMAPIFVLAICVVLFAIDCLPNGMPCPVYVLAGGAVISTALSRKASAVSVLDSARSAPAVNAAPRRRLYPKV